MADPKTPKQLSEDSVFDEFTQTGNIYVDNSYSGAETTPATSPVTGEALEFGVNAFDNLNGSNTVPVAPEDGHAAIVTESGKFGRRALTRFAALSEIDLLVTDSGLADEDRRKLRRAGLEILKV